MVQVNLDNFSVKQITQSGQCFRINEIKPGVFRVIAYGKRLVLEQEGRRVTFHCEEKEYKDLWRRYFDLETNYRYYIDHMNEELQGLLVRKTYLTGLLSQYTDPEKQGEYYTDKIVHMIVPMTAEDKAQAEGMGLDMGQAADPEGGTENMKTAMKTIIKASPFDRAMKVEAELNKLNGRIIKLLDSMRAQEMETQRIELEKLKYNLAKQKALGEFDVDPAEEEGEE